MCSKKYNEKNVKKKIWYSYTSENKNTKIQKKLDENGAKIVLTFSKFVFFTCIVSSNKNVWNALKIDVLFSFANK